MCGIFGSVQARGDVVRDILRGLRRLEYRGYDSAGVAVIHDGRCDVRRRLGKLSALEEFLATDGLSQEARVGIGHTRWATHGPPSDRNAHPHTDGSGKLVLIHNGIIENYLEVRDRLIALGHEFTSDTDSEVLAHLVGHHLSRLRADESALHPLTEAVLCALREVRGAWALAVIHADHPDRIVAARKDSPLVIGRGDGATYLASDIPAFLEHTRRVQYVLDHEVVEVSAEGARILNLQGEVVEREEHYIEWDAQAAEKGGHPHYMFKEILEQPDVIARTAFTRLHEETGDVRFEEFPWGDAEFQEFDRIQLIACGTSLHAALVAKFLFERWTRLPTEVDFASEYRYRDPVESGRTLAISISQSGETIDTIGALRMASERGARTLTICNVKGSTLVRESEAAILTHAGPEIGVASTKAFTAQLVALYLLAVRMGRARGRMSLQAGREKIQDLRELVPRLEHMLHGELPEQIRVLSREVSTHRGFLFIGRGINYPVALEGALKLKEITYLHAEGYPAGEMKHGPIALVDEDLLTVVVATRSRVYDKVLSNVEEIRARKGPVLVVATEGDEHVAGLGDRVIHVPETSEELSPIVASIPLQLLAYHVADALEREIDQPRNLAKSVTVE